MHLSRQRAKASRFYRCRGETLTVPQILRACRWLAGLAVLASLPSQLRAEIMATHIYHNHMPHFWPYFQVESYEKMAVGDPIRYAYDGQVIMLKKNPPADYPRLPNGAPMPHDPLTDYYGHHAKWQGYQYWPWQVIDEFSGQFPLSQNHVTMSAAVLNNVESLSLLQIPELGDKYAHPTWGDPWRRTFASHLTSGGFHALDLLHFSGHHALGPLVGREFLLKDLIQHNVTMAQTFFLGTQFQPSYGFFPTELGFSSRIIPTLRKLGIRWSPIGNIHFSRTLIDYPYLNDPGVDTLISPPNRADLRNTAAEGRWVARPMTNEQQVTHNKFPFAALPHWVRYVDPQTGEELRVAGIPVEQAASWEEGYMGSAKADFLQEFDTPEQTKGRKPYFVIAHDGDNSSGRAGSMETWRAAYTVTYAQNGVRALGVDEYLAAYPIPDDDVVHVQDGSWIDTRDSAGDPAWYHWHLPFGVWAAGLNAFNKAYGTSYRVRNDPGGRPFSHMVSLELGFNFQERNFALLMPVLNYAMTAEQIWLDDHPSYYQPKDEREHALTYSGNQLNPLMYSYPVKGDPHKDYRDGANPAELAWYFLLPAMDSGFGYYDENVDDSVKPTLSLGHSLYFSRPYVDDKLTRDRTGPAVFWPQRYPYNPGSVNCSKAEGWAKLYANTEFAVYTYAYDVSGIRDIAVMIRTHTQNIVDPLDKTPDVYHPAVLQDDGRVDPTRVSDWQRFAMTRRDLTGVINGVPWQEDSARIMRIVPAQLIGSLYYAYFDQFRGQVLDYYVEAEDKLGNITRSDIQHVYVGQGRYRDEGNKRLIEDPAGPISGLSPFMTREP